MPAPAGWDSLLANTGVLEATLGGVVGARVYLAASDHGVVGGGWVNHKIFFWILAISLVWVRLDVSYNLCSKLGSKLIFLDKIMATLVLPDHLWILTAFSKAGDF
jgi:hypothetical protein